MKKMKFVILATLLFSSGLFTSCNKSNIDVMVIGVNTKDWEEIDLLIDALEYRNQEEIDGLNFYTGKIGNKNIAIGETPIGSSEAAMTTTIGIKQYHPRCVITEGTSGGHHDQAKIYDIVLGKNIYDVASFKGPADHPLEWVGEYNGLQNPILHSDENLLATAKGIEDKYKYGAIKSDGAISSSDCWNTIEGKDFVNELHERLNDDCEEMETYAVSNVCGYYKIPVLAIRIISNNLYIENPADLEKIKLAGDYVQQYTLNVINAI